MLSESCSPSVEIPVQQPPLPSGVSPHRSACLFQCTGEYFFLKKYTRCLLRLSFLHSSSSMHGLCGSGCCPRVCRHPSPMGIGTHKSSPDPVSRATTGPAAETQLGGTYMADAINMAGTHLDTYSSQSRTRGMEGVLPAFPHVSLCAWGGGVVAGGGEEVGDRPLPHFRLAPPCSLTPPQTAKN